VVAGSTGDGGVDGFGILQSNALASFKVLLQCKRYTKSVWPSHVRDFRGAMAGRADKGIITTLRTFTAEARREATRDGVPPTELIDGEKLLDMLAKRELGLRPCMFQCALHFSIPATLNPLVAGSIPARPTNRIMLDRQRREVAARPGCRADVAGNCRGAQR
jgi:hypothetical protein